MKIPSEHGIKLNIKLSLWSALKLRIAGIGNVLEHKRVGEIEKTIIRKDDKQIQSIKLSKIIIPEDEIEENKNS